MLTRFHQILIAALVVQLGLAGYMLTRSDDTAAQKSQPLLPGFDAAKVTKLAVTGSGKSVSLAKVGDTWVVSSAFDYPVEASKISDALAPLAKLAAAAPIATQQSRAKQLRVADDDFEKKVVVTVDGKDVTLYVGQPAGMRRTAVRLAGSDDVYAVSLQSWQYGVEPRDWVDNSYVNVPEDDIAKITVAKDGHTAELDHGDKWTVSIDGAPVKETDKETFDDGAVSRMVMAASRVQLDTPADPKRDASHPTATITIERKPKKDQTVAPVVLDVIFDAGMYWVKDRSLGRAATVDKSRIDELVNVSRDKLVMKKPEPAKPAEAATPGAPPGAPKPAAPKAPAMPAPK